MKEEVKMIGREIDLLRQALELNGKWGAVPGYLCHLYWPYYPYCLYPVYPVVTTSTSTVDSDSHRR